MDLLFLFGNPRAGPLPGPEALATVALRTAEWIAQLSGSLKGRGFRKQTAGGAGAMRSDKRRTSSDSKFTLLS